MLVVVHVFLVKDDQRVVVDVVEVCAEQTRRPSETVERCRSQQKNDCRSWLVCRPNYADVSPL